VTLIRFARMCESLESTTPTKAADIINQSISSFDNKEALIDILCEYYPTNNIGSKRAYSWIANAFGIFEEEIKSAEYSWLDLSEAMGQFVGNNVEDSNICLNMLHRLLTLDCSTIDGNSFILFKEYITQMSGIEVKWFLRYWLRLPRNGVTELVVSKALVKYYSNPKILEYVKYHTLTNVCVYLDNGNEPTTTAEHGLFIKPMLAKNWNTSNSLPLEYVMDVKYDGNRYQIHKYEQKVIIFNRKGKVVTNQYTDVKKIIQSFDGSFIIDTEIYPVDLEGKPVNHKLLAKRVHSKDKQQAIEECPVRIAIFDIMMFMGESLIEETYRNRLIHLKGIPSEYLSLMYNRDYTGAIVDMSFEAAYNSAINDGYEGIMIKDLNATYDVGRRSSNLLKHKPPRIELDVVITSASYGEGKLSDVFGSYGISVKEDGEYIQIGSVGTGFSDLQRRMLTTELKKIVDVFYNGVFHFLPRRVIQVTADMIQIDSEGKYALRFPRLVRLRDDKFPSEVNTIDDLKQMIF
jgi:DNA ligase 1